MTGSGIKYFIFGFHIQHPNMTANFPYSKYSLFQHLSLQVEKYNIQELFNKFAEI